MRKILASILVLAMALVSFSMVAFAAPATDVYFGADGVTSVTADEDVYSVDVYYDPSSHAVPYDGIYYIGTLNMNIAVTGATLTYDAEVEGLENDANTSDKISFSSAGDGAILDGPVKFATFTVTREGDAAETVVTISSVESADYDDSYSPTAGSLTIKWPSAAEPVATEYTLGNTTYTNVPNVTVTKTISSATIAGNVLIDYLKDEVAKEASKAFSVVIGNFTGAGSATFDVALMGVPSTVTVTGIDVELN